MVDGFGVLDERPRCQPEVDDEATWSSMIR